MLAMLLHDVQSTSVECRTLLKQYCFFPRSLGISRSKLLQISPEFLYPFFSFCHPLDLHLHRTISDSNDRDRNKNSRSTNRRFRSVALIICFMLFILFYYSPYYIRSACLPLCQRLLWLLLSVQFLVHLLDPCCLVPLELKLQYASQLLVLRVLSVLLI
jgi:hypothetical protein